MSDIFIEFEGAMTSSEREDFLDNFVKANPHWAGAQVADVLDHLANIDANLDLVEPVFEAHEEDTDRPDLIGHAVRVVFWSQGREAVTWENVSELLQRNGW